MGRTEGMKRRGDEPVGGLDALLKGGHKAIAGLEVGRNLGVLDLEEKGELVRVGIALLDHLVARPANLDRAANGLGSRAVQSENRWPR